MEFSRAKGETRRRRPLLRSILFTAEASNHDVANRDLGKNLDGLASWQEYTHKFVSNTHSLTVADVQGKTLTVRQVSSEGRELDRFIVTK